METVNTVESVDATDTVNLMSLGTLKAAMQARIPAMLVGDPGTGKTAVIRALATDMDYKLITLVGSQMDPTDIVGLPKGEKMGLSDAGEEIWGTVNLSPWWQVEILKKKRVVLFLDEFSNTAGATRASMLTMLQNREFPNGHAMPDETIVIGAMNPAEQAADGYTLDAPTTNRMLFIPWKTSADSWYSGMLNAWGKKATTSAEEMEWRHKIVKFLKDNPSWLHRMAQDVKTGEAFGANLNDASEKEIFGYAWASRRSWDNLSRVLAFSPKDSSIQDMIAQGLVGYSAAAQFRDFLRKNETISVKDALDDPKSVAWDSISPNDMSLLMRAITDSMEFKTVEKTLNVFEIVAKSGRAAEASTYVLDVLKGINTVGGSEADKKKFKARAMEVLKMYREVSAQATARS